MKKTLIAASIAALSAGFVAAPALAEISAHAGATLTQPTDSNADTTLNLEVGVVYDHESGAYAGALFETFDLLNGDFEDSSIELNLGYGAAIDAAMGYDVGLTFTLPLDSDADTTYELYAGATYALDEVTSLSGYFYLPEAEFDTAYLEFGVEYAGLEAVDVFGLLTLGLSDNETKTLELGVGKEVLPQQYVTAAFILDIDDTDGSALEFTYTYSF